MNNNNELTITELESYYNLVKNLIDETISFGKANPNNYHVQTELNKLNKYRDRITYKIKTKLDETFSE